MRCLCIIIVQHHWVGGVLRLLVQQAVSSNQSCMPTAFPAHNPVKVSEPVRTFESACSIVAEISMLQTGDPPLGSLTGPLAGAKALVQLPAPHCWKRYSHCCLKPASDWLGMLIQGWCCSELSGWLWGPARPQCALPDPAQWLLAKQAWRCHHWCTAEWRCSQSSRLEGYWRRGRPTQGRTPQAPRC